MAEQIQYFGTGWDIFIAKKRVATYSVKMSHLTDKGTIFIHVETLQCINVNY